MSRRLKTWIALTAAVAVVAAVAVFLSLHTLAQADSWSSIGGFLTALVTVAASGTAWARRDRSEPDDPRRPRGGWRVFNIGNGLVFNGDNARNSVILKSSKAEPEASESTE